MSGRGRRAVAVVVSCASVALASAPAWGALPVFHGGALTLAAPSPVRTLDPAQVDDPFEAALVRAAIDTLYRVTPSGTVVPELAAEAPLVEGTRVRIRIRTDVERVGGHTLTAQTVAASLAAAMRERRGRAFLEAFADARGRPQITVIDDEHLELVPARPDIDVARVLAAAPLGIATGRDRRRRPIGTGPFSARLLASGELTMTGSRSAQRGAPYLALVRVQPPRERDDALRAFELGELDASFFGESLYGGTPVRPAAGGAVATRVSVLLVPNRAHGALRDPGLWGALARAVDRARLARAGIDARDTLTDALPAPRLPAARRPARFPTLRVALEAGDAASARLADTLSAILDESSIAVVVTTLPPDRYAGLVSTSGWDLRFAYVVPPYDDERGMALSALAETGQMDEARTLVRDGGLADPSVEARQAALLEALVLGRLRGSFHARADLVGRRFARDVLPALEELHYTRQTLLAPRASTSASSTDEDAEEGAP